MQINTPTRNPRWNAGNETIDCEIEHPQYGWIPFTASPDDPEQHGRDIFADLVASGNVAPHVPLDPAEVLAAEQAARIAELKQLLRDSDYVALPDYDKDKADVIAQRQAWRDEIRSLEA
jgi:hypothetical protein